MYLRRSSLVFFFPLDLSFQNFALSHVLVATTGRQSCLKKVSGRERFRPHRTAMLRSALSGSSIVHSRVDLCGCLSLAQLHDRSHLPTNSPSLFSLVIQQAIKLSAISGMDESAIFCYTHLVTFSRVVTYPHLNLYTSLCRKVKLLR